MMVTIDQLDQWFREKLPLDDLKTTDSSLNGLQVGQKGRTVKKIAFAVDACMETFKRARQQEADMLFVHHGLFWGREQAVTGLHYQRLEFLIQNNLALYAAHLPLDKDLKLGNNMALARRLKLQQVQEFGRYHGTCIGVKGRLPQPLTLKEVEEKLFGPTAYPVQTMPFGEDSIETLGIISGGAPWEVMQAQQEGLDLYITGESNHSIYHFCQESKMNALFGGHYQTECGGVLQVKEAIEEDFSLETCFIDIPTGF